MHEIIFRFIDPEIMQTQRPKLKEVVEGEIWHLQSILLSKQ